MRAVIKSKEMGNISISGYLIGKEIEPKIGDEVEIGTFYVKGKPIIKRKGILLGFID